MRAKTAAILPLTRTLTPAMQWASIQTQTRRELASCCAACPELICTLQRVQHGGWLRAALAHLPVTTRMTMTTSLAATLQRWRA